jgi:hypothetical protein
MIDDTKLYEEAGQGWRHFASWREKTFAGYLTALAALAIGFTQQPVAPMRILILGGAILVSAVFWILESRSRELINACQLAADRLEQARGCYADLNRLRFHRDTWVTYGFAVGLFVGVVSAASVGGMCLYAVRWWLGNPNAWPVWPAVAAAILLPLFPLLLKRIAEKERAKSTAEYRAADFYDLAALQAARGASGAAEQRNAPDEGRADGSAALRR